jgi:hypothetical protein
MTDDFSVGGIVPVMAGAVALGMVAKIADTGTSRWTKKKRKMRRRLR